MPAPFTRAYALFLVKTCPRRGAPAMGGMAAQIPIKNDPAANEAALETVRKNKLREVTDGGDGTWVAHPGLVGIAKKVFDKHMPGRNQSGGQRPDVNVSAKDLLAFQPEKPITETGLRNNISVGIQYLGAWLAGNGCVPVFNLMEDAATAEISRSQIWQWIRSPKGVLEDGRKVTVELFRALLEEEESVLEAQLDQRAERGALGLREVDLPFPALRVVHVARLGRDVQIAQYRQLSGDFVFQPGAERGIPTQLVRVLLRSRLLPVRRVEAKNAHITHSGGDDALQVVGEIGDAARFGRKRRTGKDGDAVVGLLAAIDDAIARRLDLCERKVLVLGFGFLQANGVGLNAAEPVEEMRESDLEGVDVPGRDPERH